MSNIYKVAVRAGLTLCLMFHADSISLMHLALPGAL